MLVRVAEFTVPSEETCEFSVPHPADPRRSLRLTLMATDPSAYLTSDHVFFCCTDSPNVPETVKATLVDGLCDHAAGKGSIAEAVGFLARGVAKHIGSAQTIQDVERALKLATGSQLAPPTLRTAATASKSAFVDDDDDGEDGFFDDELFGLGTAKSAGPTDTTKAALQRDFLQILAEGYRPGFIETGDGCIVSVSSRIGKLGVGLQALQAWDSKFVGEHRSWYLVLLIFVPSFA